MKRFAPLMLLTAVACVTFAAYASPLGKAKQAAQTTRAAAEDAHAGHDHAADADVEKEAHAEHAASEAPAVTRAVAVMLPTEGNTAHGSIIFAQNGTSMTVTASVKGLGSGTTHGFHIHEFGDVSKPDGKGTGGHFNPDGHDHALMDPNVGHAGDLGNLEADDDGNATYSATFEGLTLYDGARAIMGRGVIIHAKPDDGGQPTGNAGARIAQGVIGVAGPK